MFKLINDEPELTSDGKRLIQECVDHELGKKVRPYAVTFAMFSGLLVLAVSFIINMNANAAVASVENKYEKKLDTIVDDARIKSNELLKMQWNAQASENRANSAAERVERNAVIVEGELENFKSQITGAQELVDAAEGLKAASDSVVAKVSNDLMRESNLGAALSYVPIGSVIAWPGNIATMPNRDNWQECSSQAQAEYNPHLADALGGLYGNPDKIAVNQKIKLPNFEGVFLRGSHGLAEPIGVKQNYATARPHNDYKIPKSGGHAHSGGKGTGSMGMLRNDAGQGNGLSGDNNSNHNHIIVGGDEETRPDNYAVVWLIRVK